jgi:TolB-like protein
MNQKTKAFILPFLFFPAMLLAGQEIQPPNAREEPSTEATSLSRVAVAGYCNKTGDESFDIPAKTATDTLTLSLKLLNRYDVIAGGELPDEPANRSDETFLEWSHRHNYDYVLYGSIEKTASGAQQYQLGVFDRVKQKTTIQQTAQGESILDVFSVSDTLCVSMLQAVTGRHIGFGSIAFRTIEPQDDCDVILDGHNVSRGTAPIGRVLAGQHRLSVVTGGENAELLLFNQTISVKESGQATIELLPAREAIVVPRAKGSFVWTGEDRWTGYEDQQLNRGTSRCVLFVEREVIDGTLYHTFSAIGATTGDDRYSFAGLCVTPSRENIDKLRAAGGISFKFQGDGKPYRLMVGTADMKDADWYQKTFATKEGKTTEVRIPWSALRQEGWGERAKFDKKNILKVAFETVVDEYPAPFSFKVFDIRMF